MQTILITGGSGLLGTYLTQQLIKQNFKVIIVGRKTTISNQPNLSYAVWNLQQQIIDESAIKQADVIVNLAGANVGSERWTVARKKEIVDSRVLAGKLLVKSLQNIPNNVRCVIQASATGWYKLNTNGEPNREEEASNDDFLGETCKLWEESIDAVTNLSKRLVVLRFGIILSNNGGALKEFKKPLGFRMAPILGSGKQKISWLHIHDAASIILYAITNKECKGVFNAVSPEITTNKAFMISLAKKLCGKMYFPFFVPSFLLKLVLGGMSEEVLKSTCVSSSKLVSQGFEFSYPNLDIALDHLIKNREI